ncbi:hypothetical protein AEA09_16250 [Lysinibacillus contaminans]|uniref:Peptidase M16 C-terminal domain-containing protein n=1 Tax=Lysinibacillus contaminans TaxID=1293441 RepID=A0ABR5JXT3_9BACI|nr:insulinase family protein [Lysinibacillus contaminans]KOS66792.1 hypothetical protein AEA09_16250 [Lysinibacillus contaminans]
MINTPLINNCKALYFKTDKFSTISLAINSFEELKDSVKFEEKNIIFNALGNLRKEQLKTKFDFDTARYFISSTNMYFNNQFRTYGTRIIHPKFTSNGIDYLEDIIYNLVDFSNLKDSLSELHFNKAKQDMILRIQQQRSNPFSYSAARLLENIFDNKRYGTEILGNLEIYKALSFPDKKCIETYLNYFNNQNKQIFILGDISEDLLPLDTYNPIVHSQPLIVNRNFESIDRRIDNVNQTIITLGFYFGPIQSYKEYLTIQLIDSTLGKYGHSKLFDQLRNKDVSIYHIITRYDSMNNILLVSICVPYDYEDKVKDKIIKSILEFESHPVDLEMAKQFFMNEIYYLLDTPEGTMSYFNILNRFSISLNDIQHNMSQITYENFSDFVSNRMEYIGMHILRGSAYEKD